jgi:hypothetical protein
MLTKLEMKARALLTPKGREPGSQKSPYAPLLDALTPTSIPRRVVNRLTKLTRVRKAKPEVEAGDVELKVEVREPVHVWFPQGMVEESVVEGRETSHCKPMYQPLRRIAKSAAESPPRRVSPANSLLASDEGMLWLAFQRSTEDPGSGPPPIVVATDNRGVPVSDGRELGHIPAESSARNTVHSNSSSWETFTNSSTSPGRDTPAKSEAAAVTSDEVREVYHSNDAAWQPETYPSGTSSASSSPRADVTDTSSLKRGRSEPLQGSPVPKQCLRRVIARLPTRKAEAARVPGSTVDTPSSPSSDSSTVVPSRTPRTPELQRLFRIGAISFEEAVVNIRAATASALLSQNLVPTMERETSTDELDDRPPPLMTPRRRSMEPGQTPTDAVLVPGDAPTATIGADAAQHPASGEGGHRNWDSLSTTVSVLQPGWVNHGLQQAQALAQVPVSTASHTLAPVQPTNVSRSEQTAAPQLPRTMVPVQEPRWADMSSNISSLSPGFPNRGLPQHQDSPTPAGRNVPHARIHSTLGEDPTSTRGRVLHVNRRGGLNSARGRHNRGESSATANLAFFMTRGQRPDSHPGPRQLPHGTVGPVPVENSPPTRLHPNPYGLRQPASTPQVDTTQATFPNGLADIDIHWHSTSWRRAPHPAGWNPPAFNVAFHDATRDRAREITPNRHNRDSVSSSPLSNHFVDATTPFEPRPPSPPLPTNIVENLEARVNDFRGFYEDLQQQRDTLRAREQEIAAEKAEMEEDLRGLDRLIAHQDRRQVELYEECMQERVNADALIAKAEREVLYREDEAEQLGNDAEDQHGNGTAGEGDELGNDVLAADQHFNGSFAERSRTSGMEATEGFMNLNVHRWLEARSTNVAVGGGEVPESPAVHEAARLLRESAI